MEKKPVGPVDHSEVKMYCESRGLLCTEDLTAMFNKYYSEREWKNREGKPLKTWTNAYRAYIRILEGNADVPNPRPAIVSRVSEAAHQLTERVPFVAVEVQTDDTPETLRAKLDAEEERLSKPPQEAIDSLNRAKEEGKSYSYAKEIPVYEAVPETDITDEEGFSGRVLIPVLWFSIGTLAIGAVTYFMCEHGLFHAVWNWIKDL